LRSPPAWSVPHSIMNESPPETYVVPLEPGQTIVGVLVAVLVAVLEDVLEGVPVDDELPVELTLGLELVEVEVETPEEVEVEMLVAVLALVLLVLEPACVDPVAEDEATSFAPQMAFEIGAPNVDLR
jgi:hypothetical protein